MTKQDGLANVISKMTFEFFATGQHAIKPTDFFEKENTVLLDVRSKHEVKTIRLELQYHTSVIHIPFHELPEKYEHLPNDKLIAIFCTGTQRASMAFLFLQSKGYVNTRILMAPIEELVSVFKPDKIFKRVQGTK